MLPHIRALIEEKNRKEYFRNFHLPRRIMRSNSDPFALTDTHFEQLFRLDKDLVHFLIEGLTPHLNNSNRYNAIHPTLKIFTVLVFYATGTYQRLIGQSFHLSLAQETASKAIHEITSLIIETLTDRFIIFPQRVNQKNTIKEHFMARTRFPEVIEVIDCTHISIIRPNHEEHNYFNRKGFHSKNVKIICDYNLKILNINARYPGSCHDAFIWRNSIFRDELRECYEAGDHNSWLLGDSGYPQEPWLMTPVINPPQGSLQERYNNALCSARNGVERCIGVLKARFRCLLGERKLRYTPDFVGNITVACAILHNLCIQRRLQNPDYHGGNLNNTEHVENMHDMDLEDTRTVLINRYFN